MGRRTNTVSLFLRTRKKLTLLSRTQNDVLMLISYSGKTAELLALLTHIALSTPLIAITSHNHIAACPLLTARPGAILLPAPIHELEETSFGVCAPTTSTTVTIAVGDMLALTVADALHDDTRDVFARNHPGGAIGAKTRKLTHHNDHDDATEAQTEAETEVREPEPAPDGLITPPAS
jgi:D-arabinose 5-phosphate isomerase GutQ